MGSGLQPLHFCKSHVMSKLIADSELVLPPQVKFQEDGFKSRCWYCSVTYSSIESIKSTIRTGNGRSSFLFNPKAQPLEQMMAKERSILCEIRLNVGKVPFITHTNQVETWVFLCLCQEWYWYFILDSKWDGKARKMKRFNTFFPKFVCYRCSPLCGTSTTLAVATARNSTVRTERYTPNTILMHYASCIFPIHLRPWSQGIVTFGCPPPMMCSLWQGHRLTQTPRAITVLTRLQWMSAGWHQDQ